MARKLGIPVVYEIRAFWEDAAVDHGTTSEGSLRYRATRRLETRAIKQVDHVFTICEGLRSDIAARGIPADKITVIPNAVDVELSLIHICAQGVFEQHAERSGTDDPLALIQYLDLKTYLVGDINTKVDRASMAHSLEVREPLMDHELIEWLATLPSSFKVRGQEGKYLLKKAMEPHLSQDILYRPKMGFSVPLARWFRGPLKERVRQAVLGPRLAATGWFNRDYLQHLVDAHQSGMRDYSAPLWTCLLYTSRCV